MSTKYRIIFGFAVMVVLLAGVVAFGYKELRDISVGFDDYRARARSAVNANAADALLRESKDKLNSFVSTANVEYAGQARENLAKSIKFIEETVGVEPDAGQKEQLIKQVALIKEISDLTRVTQDKLLFAGKLLKEQLVPAAAAINDRLTDINKVAMTVNNIKALEAIDDLYSAYADLRVAVNVYSLGHNPEDAAKSKKWLGDFNGLLEKLNGVIVREETRRAFGVLKQTYAGYVGAFNSMDAAIRESVQARKQLSDTVAGIALFFDGYTAAAQAEMNKLGAGMRKTNDTAQRLMTTLGGGGLLLGLIFALWIVVGIVRTLSRVSAFAGEVAGGDFNAVLNVRERGEIGVMVESIRRIPATLNDIAAEYAGLEQRIEGGYLDVQGDVSKFSGGFATLLQGSNNILRRMGMIFDNIPSPMVMLNKDLKAAYLNASARELAGSDYRGKTCAEMFCREDYGSSSCGLMNAVNTSRISSGETVARPRGKRMDVRYTAIPMQNAQGKLSAVLQFIVDLTQIKDTERKILEVANQAMTISDRVAAASEELSTQVEQVSRGAEVQRRRVESTATAMNEMNSTVLEVARNAGHASEQSEETRKKADGGAALVNRVVSAINDVNTVALGLQDNMKELGRQAESIGGVMNVISDIADQTNLLALNAAIEAARAGDAGRGFAVVADEVRKLAEKTMNATHEVGENIQAIQNSARSNIGEVTSAVKNIGQATELADASGQALHEIVSLASSNSSVVASIAAAAEEQSATSEEITSALEEVSRIVAETSEGMTQASAAVQDLSRTAQELKRVMEGLR